MALDLPGDPTDRQVYIYTDPVGSVTRYIWIKEQDAWFSQAEPITGPPGPLGPPGPQGPVNGDYLPITGGDLTGDLSVVGKVEVGDPVASGYKQGFSCDSDESGGSYFQVYGKNEDVATTFAVYNGDLGKVVAGINSKGATTFAAGGFAIQSNGDISTNIRAHGNIELESNAAFKTPKVKLFAETGNANFAGTVAAGDAKFSKSLDVGNPSTSGYKKGFICVPDETSGSYFQVYGKSGDASTTFAVWNGDLQKIVAGIDSVGNCGFEGDVAIGDSSALFSLISDVVAALSAEIREQYADVIATWNLATPYTDVATTLPADIPTPLKDAIVRVTTAGKINLNSDGSASFKGDITSELNADYKSVVTTNGTIALYGAGNLVTYLDNDGAATFRGRLECQDPNATGLKEGFVCDNDDGGSYFQVYTQDAHSNNAFSIYNGTDGSARTVASITPAGAAEFADDITCAKSKINLATGSGDGYITIKDSSETSNIVLLGSTGAATFAGDITSGDYTNNSTGVKIWESGYISILGDKDAALVMYQDTADAAGKKIELKASGEASFAEGNFKIYSSGAIDTSSIGIGAPGNYPIVLSSDGSATFVGGLATIDKWGQIDVNTPTSTGYAFQSRVLDGTGTCTISGSGAATFAGGNINLFEGGEAYFAGTVDISDPATSGIRLSSSGAATFTGTVTSAGSFAIQLEADDPTKYDVTTEEYTDTETYEVEVPILRPEGVIGTADLIDEPKTRTVTKEREVTKTREVRTYNGAVLDVKERIQQADDEILNLKMIIDSLERTVQSLELKVNNLSET